MKNKRVLIAFIVMFLALVMAMCAWAAKTDKKKDAAAKDVCANTEMTQEQAMAVIRETYPKFRIDELRKMQVPGIWEVTAGQNILYFEPKSKTLVFGEMVKPDGQNLTQIRRMELSEKAVKTLPLAKAVKIGSGPNVVINFTDPECPYCKKVAAYMRDHEKEVTQYVFLMPIKSVASRSKAAYILASKDPGKAYNEIDQDKIKGVDWNSYKVPDDIDVKLKEHMTEAQKLNIRGTPHMFINGKAVAGANMPMIEQLIKEKK
jgi:thiol:disulfide interchange protein DsbC